MSGTPAPGWLTSSASIREPLLSLLRGFFECFNVLDSDDPYGFWSRALAPGEDFVPFAILPPRGAMVGVEMEF